MDIAAAGQCVYTRRRFDDEIVHRDAADAALDKHRDRRRFGAEAVRRRSGHPTFQHRHRRRAHAVEIGRRGRSQVGVDYGYQARIEGHGHMEVGENTVALEVGSQRRFHANARIAEELRIEIIDIEHHVGQVIGAAVGPGEARALGDQVAGDKLGIVKVGRHRSERERRDGLGAGVIEGEQLARIGLAVQVEIAPDAQAAEIRIERIDDAVAIAIEQRKLGETGDIRSAEQLGAVVDQPVAVEVARQQPVAGQHPADPFGKPVGVEIEAGRHPRQGGEFNRPIAVEIEHQRIDARERIVRIEGFLGGLDPGDNGSGGADRRQVVAEQPEGFDREFENTEARRSIRGVHIGPDRRARQEHLHAIDIDDGLVGL